MTPPESSLLRIPHGYWGRQVVGACFAAIMAWVTWLLFHEHDAAHPGSSLASASWIDYFFNGEERALERTGLAGGRVSQKFVLTLTGLFAAFAVLLLIRIETAIDLKSGRLSRLWTWLGWFVLIRREYSISDFRCVKIKRVTDSDGWFSWSVSMVQMSGVETQLQWFDDHEESCPEKVREFADKVACATGLDINESCEVHADGLVEAWRRRQNR